MSLTKEKKTELRKFGLLVGSIFAVIAFSPLLRDRPLNQFFFIVSIAFVLTGVIIPTILLPIHFIWMKVGHLLGKINSFIFLAVIFYFIFTPVHFLMNIWYHENKFKFGYKKDTYWIKRQPENYRETMKRQF